MRRGMMLASFLSAASPLAASAQDEIDQLQQQVPAERRIQHGYSDFTDPLGRFIDLLAAGAFVEAKPLQPEACANWLATRQHSAMTGKFWVWNTLIDLNTLCSHS